MKTMRKLISVALAIITVMTALPVIAVSAEEVTGAAPKVYGADELEFISSYTEGMVGEYNYYTGIYTYTVTDTDNVKFAPGVSSTHAPTISLKDGKAFSDEVDFKQLPYIAVSYDVNMANTNPSETYGSMALFPFAYKEETSTSESRGYPTNATHTYELNSTATNSKTSVPASNIREDSSGNHVYVQGFNFSDIGATFTPSNPDGNLPYKFTKIGLRIRKDTSFTMGDTFSVKWVGFFATPEEAMAYQYTHDYVEPVIYGAEDLTTVVDSTAMPAVFDPDTGELVFTAASDCASGNSPGNNVSAAGYYPSLKPADGNPFDVDFRKHPYIAVSYDSSFPAERQTQDAFGSMAMFAWFTKDTTTKQNWPKSKSHVYQLNAKNDGSGVAQAHNYTDSSDPDKHIYIQGFDFDNGGFTYNPANTSGTLPDTFNHLALRINSVAANIDQGDTFTIKWIGFFATPEAAMQYQYTYAPPSVSTVQFFAKKANSEMEAISEATELEQGQEIAFPEAPSYSGHTFSHWARVESDGTFTNLGTSPSLTAAGNNAAERFCAVYTVKEFDSVIFSAEKLDDMLTLTADSYYEKVLTDGVLRVTPKNKTEDTPIELKSNHAKLMFTSFVNGKTNRHISYDDYPIAVIGFKMYNENVTEGYKSRGAVAAGRINKSGSGNEMYHTYNNLSLAEKDRYVCTTATIKNEMDRLTAAGEDVSDWVWKEFSFFPYTNQSEGIVIDCDYALDIEYIGFFKNADDAAEFIYVPATKCEVEFYTQIDGDASMTLIQNAGVTLENGDKIVFPDTPELAGGEFLYWTAVEGDTAGEQIDPDDQYAVGGGEAQRFCAYYNELTYTIKVTATEGGSVNVELEKGEQTGDREYTIRQATGMTLTAIPEADHKLRNWYDITRGNNVIISGAEDGSASDTLVYVPESNMTINANFMPANTPVPARLIAFVGADGNGKISANGRNDYYFEDYTSSDSPITLTAIPNNGYCAAYWIRFTSSGMVEVLMNLGDSVEAYPLGGDVFYQPIFVAEDTSVTLYVDNSTNEILGKGTQPTPPSKKGYTFEGYVQRGDAGNNVTVMETKYVKAASSNPKLQVIGVDSSSVTSKSNPAYGEGFNIKKTETVASPVWRMSVNGEGSYIISLSSSFIFNYMFNDDTAIVITESDEVVTDAQINTVATWNENDGSNYYTRFTGAFALPEGTELIDHGIMMSQDKSKLEGLTADGENIDVPAGVIMGRIEDNTESATPLFTISKKLNDQSDKWYGRAYLIYKIGTDYHTIFAQLLG